MAWPDHVGIYFQHFLHKLKLSDPVPKATAGEFEPEEMGIADLVSSKHLALLCLHLH